MGSRVDMRVRRVLEGVVDSMTVVEILIQNFQIMAVIYWEWRQILLQLIHFYHHGDVHVSVVETGRLVRLAVLAAGSWVHRDGREVALLVRDQH